MDYIGNVLNNIEKYHKKIFDQYRNENKTCISLNSPSVFTNKLIECVQNTDSTDVNNILTNIFDKCNVEAFKQSQLDFTPTRIDNLSLPSLPPELLEAQSKPLSFYISIHDGMYNAQVWKKGKWRPIKNRQTGRLWHNIHNKSWHYILEYFADDIEYPYELLKKNSFVALSGSELILDDAAAKEHSAKWIQESDFPHVKIIDYSGLDKFYPGNSIFYLGWDELHVIVPKLNGPAIHNMPFLGLRSFFQGCLPNASQDRFEYICKRMMIEPTDEQANLIGSMDHIVGLPLDALKNALITYMDQLSPSLPGLNSTRLEGWFNSRLFQSLLPEYGFKPKINFGSTNVLGPWHLILARNTIYE